MTLNPALLSLGSGALDLVAMFYPPAAPIIGLIKKAAPYIAAAIPLVEAGIKEGPGAFAAVKEAAPELSKIIEDLANKARDIGKGFGLTDEGHIENIARTLFKLPRMTPEEELHWMNTTAGNDPSEENSQKGSG